MDTGAVTLIDFDDCAYGWFAMDIAMLLFDAVILYGQWAQDPSVRFFDEMLAGYRTVKPFAD